jgi:hypothetical protein
VEVPEESANQEGRQRAVYRKCDGERKEEGVYHNLSLWAFYEKEESTIDLKISGTVMKLSERDRRALIIGAVCAVGILAFTFGTKWVGHWTEVRKSIAEKRATIANVGIERAQQKRLMSIVPVFEDPNEEEEQKIRFRDKFSEQLKKAGFKRGAPIRVLRAKRAQAGTGYRVLGLQTRGECKFQQILDLLTNIYENPYLVGIEEMRMECDPKKRQKFKLNLTVSTFVK